MRDFLRTRAAVRAVRSGRAALMCLALAAGATWAYAGPQPGGLGVVSLPAALAEALPACPTCTDAASAPQRAAQAQPAGSAPAPNEPDRAAQVLLGRKTCAQGRTVRIEADARAPGQFTLSHGRQRLRLRLVESATGTIRLEDRAQGMVWIQLANKSMLLNQRQGRRVLDECGNAAQQAVAAELKRQPASDLLEWVSPPTAVPLR